MRHCNVKPNQYCQSELSYGILEIKINLETTLIISVPYA